MPGVVSAVSGYTGGTTKNPTYEEVSSGGTGHAESVEVVYDPKKISYEKILEIFWHNVDPLTPNGQFCDHGDQYRTAIFYHDEAQRKAAEASKAKVEQRALQGERSSRRSSRRPTFYPAEEYHQEYTKKNPVRATGSIVEAAAATSCSSRSGASSRAEGHKERP